LLAFSSLETLSLVAPYRPFRSHHSLKTSLVYVFQIDEWICPLPGFSHELKCDDNQVLLFSPLMMRNSTDMLVATFDQLSVVIFLTNRVETMALTTFQTRDGPEWTCCDPIDDPEENSNKEEWVCIDPSQLIPYPCPRGYVSSHSHLTPPNILLKRLLTKTQ